MKRSDFPILRKADPSKLVPFVKDSCKRALIESLHQHYDTLKEAEIHRFLKSRKDVVTVLKFFRDKQAISAFYCAIRDENVILIEVAGGGISNGAVISFRFKVCRIAGIGMWCLT